MLNNFLKSLIAVVVGNAIYFLLLTPILPAAGRHSPRRYDLGMAIDFSVCAVVYGVIELVVRCSRRGAR